MKKSIIISLLITSLLCLSSCSKENLTEVVADTTVDLQADELEDKTNSEITSNLNTNLDLLTFKEVNGKYSLDVDNLNSEMKSKYDDLVSKFTTYDFDNLAVGASSTANLLYDLGIIPSGSIATASLKDEIKEKLVEIENYNPEAGDILNIGSSMSPSIEAIIELEPDVYIFPDTLISMLDSYSYIEDAGIELLPLYQTLYTDVYIVLQAILDTTENYDDVIYDEFEKIYNVINKANELTSVYTGSEKTVALIRISSSTGSISLLDEQTPLGAIAKDLGLINILTQNNITLDGEGHSAGEFSPELLLDLDPDYIIYYGFSDVDTVALDEFEAELNNVDSMYRILQAVQSGNCLRLGNEKYLSFSSADLRTTEVIKQVSEGVYGEK